jgi:hypothetical protein
VDKRFSSFFGLMFLCVMILSGMNYIDARHPYLNELSILLLPFIFLFDRANYLNLLSKKIFTPMSNVISQCHLLFNILSSSEKTTGISQKDRVVIQRMEMRERKEVVETVDVHLVDNSSQEKFNELEKNQRKASSTYNYISMVIKATN